MTADELRAIAARHKRQAVAFADGGASQGAMEVYTQEAALLAFVRQVADGGAIVEDDHARCFHCFYCDSVARKEEDIAHAKSCLWLIAQGVKP